ncbi:hypothetical protein BT63DRAFT_477082 [Microthyrium microscopicum]|uniref:Nucleoporin Nup54 alpha-helical domain-containing protein n=1 Tax=Microthyrium microscopicum TaxID=703497 RepID=A0A6A6ULG8_9PEZI|nr:hypothetical protein BT63DRAFT_477082 [Microthyrium microscopicum]
MSAFFNNTNTSKPLFSTPTTTSGGAGLFGGAATNTSAPAAGGLFGNVTSTPAASAPGQSLFGNAAAATSGPAANVASPAPGGLFGGAATSAAPNAFGGGLFSSSANATTTAAGSSLFSAAGANTTQAPKLGLFGATSNNAQTAAPGTSAPSLLQVPAIQVQAPSISPGVPGSVNTVVSAPAAGASIFGAAKPAASLFNAPASQPQAAGSSLFGNAGAQQQQQPQQQQANGPAPLFSSLGTGGTGGLLGQQQQQNQQQQTVVPGVRIDVQNVKPTTRFFELHDGLQRDIVHVDDFIQEQIRFMGQITAFMPGHKLSLKPIPDDVDYVEKKLETVALTLDRDAAEVGTVKDLVAKDVEDARRVFGAIEHLKLPAQYQYGTSWGGAGSNDHDGDVFASTNMVPYFDKQADELDKRLQRYMQQINEITQHLGAVEEGANEQLHRVLRRTAGEDAGKERVQELASAMHTFEDAVLRVASNVGEAREGVIACSLGSQQNGHANGHSNGSVWR